MMLLHSFSFAFGAVLLEHFLGLNPHAAWHLGGKKPGQTKCLVLGKSTESIRFHQAARIP